MSDEPQSIHVTVDGMTTQVLDQISAAIVGRLAWALGGALGLTLTKPDASASDGVSSASADGVGSETPSTTS